MSNNTYNIDEKGKPHSIPLALPTIQAPAGYMQPMPTLPAAIGNFSYALGLSAESSDYTGDINEYRASIFRILIPLSLFPSIFLSQKFNARPGTSDRVLPASSIAPDSFS